MGREMRQDMMIDPVLGALASVRDAHERFPRELPSSLPSNDTSASDLDLHIPEDLNGRRVLVVGWRAGGDALAFAGRGAASVTLCDFELSADDAELDGSISRVRARDLDSFQAEHPGVFDIVYCKGLLHRVPDPAAFMQTLHRLTAPSGLLLISAMMLADP